jgi:hypothetical protein
LEPGRGQHQGDQIGQIFVYWAIVCLWLLIENYIATRFAEFSPIERLFTLGSLFINLQK